jgi:hypothetical protein
LRAWAVAAQQQLRRRQQQAARLGEAGGWPGGMNSEQSSSRRAAQSCELSTPLQSVCCCVSNRVHCMILLAALPEHQPPVEAFL